MVVQASMTGDAVAVGWLKTTALVATDRISTRLPDIQRWAPGQFITASLLITNSDWYTPLQIAEVDIQVWGAKSATSKSAPMADTARIAQLVHRAIVQFSGRCVIAAPNSGWLASRLTSITTSGFAPRVTTDNAVSRLGATVQFTYMEME